MSQSTYRLSHDQPYDKDAGFDMGGPLPAAMLYSRKTSKGCEFSFFPFSMSEDQILSTDTENFLESRGKPLAALRSYSHQNRPLGWDLRRPQAIDMRNAVQILRAAKSYTASTLPVAYDNLASLYMASGDGSSAESEDLAVSMIRLQKYCASMSAMIALQMNDHRLHCLERTEGQVPLSFVESSALAVSRMWVESDTATMDLACSNIDYDYWEEVAPTFTTQLNILAESPITEKAVLAAFEEGRGPLIDRLTSYAALKELPARLEDDRRANASRPDTCKAERRTELEQAMARFFTSRQRQQQPSSRSSTHQDTDTPSRTSNSHDSPQNHPGPSSRKASGVTARTGCAPPEVPDPAAARSSTELPPDRGSPTSLFSSTGKPPVRTELPRSLGPKKPKRQPFRDLSEQVLFPGDLLSTPKASQHKPISENRKPGCPSSSMYHPPSIGRTETSSSVTTSSGKGTHTGVRPPHSHLTDPGTLNDSKPPSGPTGLASSKSSACIYPTSFKECPTTRHKPLTSEWKAVESPWEEPISSPLSLEESRRFWQDYKTKRGTAGTRISGLPSMIGPTEASHRTQLQASEAPNRANVDMSSLIAGLRASGRPDPEIAHENASQQSGGTTENHEAMHDDPPVTVPPGVSIAILEPRRAARRHSTGTTTRKIDLHGMIRATDCDAEEDHSDSESEDEFDVRKTSLGSELCRHRI